MDVPTNYPPPASPYMGMHNKHPSPPAAFGNATQIVTASYEAHQIPHSAQQVIVRMIINILR